VDEKPEKKIKRRYKEGKKKKEGTEDLKKNDFFTIRENGF